jgi:2-hydroxychromene-2-carboxylate isomerase
MASPAPATATATVLPAPEEGSYDLEFFFDPSCPFTWLTSVWIRRVAALRDLRVRWRFLSLRFLNEGNDVAPPIVEVQQRSLGVLRVCAAARDRFGNDAVAALYRAYGERLWYRPVSAEEMERSNVASKAIDVAEVLAAVGLPTELADAAGVDTWDETIRDEGAAAIERVGGGVGAPIITYGPPAGSSLFGPVISSELDDETAVRIYDAVRVLVDQPAFSELERTKRPPLDLPLLRP